MEYSFMYETYHISPSSCGIEIITCTVWWTTRLMILRFCLRQHNQRSNSVRAKANKAPSTTAAIQALLFLSEATKKKQETTVMLLTEKPLLLTNTNKCLEQNE